MALVRTAVLILVLFVALSSALDLLSGHALSCSRQDLNCTAKQSNCMDPGWVKSHDYTPSGPENLQVSVVTREDDRGQLQPILHADWTLKDEGGIHYLKATELHVLVMSTNENHCIRYSFKDKLPMRSPSGDKWSFSSHVLVLQPSQEYIVSVVNIPKPEQGHTNFYVNRTVLVPGCQDPKIQRTQFCLERGYDWKPNITVSINNSLDVSFSPHILSEKYTVIVSCGDNQNTAVVVKTNQMSLNVMFNLDLWPTSCCTFDVVIKPFFPKCDNDCTRRKTTTKICTKAENPRQDFSPYIFVAMGIVSMFILLAVVLYFLCHKKGKPFITPSPEEPPQLPKSPPKVLVIYSQDHHLYRDVVLKLCAFLQAKCGTRVLIDLLDTTSVSMVGRIRWLEWQRQQLKNPCDKILVLCSRGVQAKWRAMCGQRPVLLREDVLSPTDDMLTPFLNLFLPDMHKAGSLGKYMVAYFDDISSEEDVPSVFDIGVRYTLMKHFEELYFRILDVEKYQPGQVNHIEGISGDEYVNCPSGKALQNAITTFQAYQLDNPDWFEKECVLSEEEVITESNKLTVPLQTPPVYECVVPVSEGPSVYIHDVDLNENCHSGHILIPDLLPENHTPSVAELLPILNPEWEHQYSSSQVEVLTNPSSYPQSVYIAEPVLNNQPLVQRNCLFLNEEHLAEMPTEDDEEESLLPINKEVSAYSVLQHSVDSGPPESSCSLIQNYLPSAEVSLSQPVEVEVQEGLSEKRSSSGSDQGYISKTSSDVEASSKEDLLRDLARLQEECYQYSIKEHFPDDEEITT